MLHALIGILNTLLPMIYALTGLAYALDFFREDPLARRAARPLLAAAVLLHAVYFGLRTVLYEHIPIASLPEVLTTIAFFLAVVYSYVEYRTKIGKTGMFLLSISFLLQTLSSSFISNTGRFPEILRSPLFGIHVGSAVMGYTAFAVSAIYGILFLLLYHDLRSSHFGLIYQRLPSLDILAKMSLRAAVLGLGFLTVTIAIGILWASQRVPGFYHDPKFITSVMVWTVYCAAVILHYGFGWTGRRTIYFSIAGFGLLIASVMAARLWLTTFHIFA